MRGLKFDSKRKHHKHVYITVRKHYVLSAQKLTNMNAFWANRIQIHILYTLYIELANEFGIHIDCLRWT